MSKEKVIDYISGNEVDAKPEEIEAVQPYLKVLVDDYGYPKNHIMAHPQYRVKVRPSDERKEYPVDIAVFDSSKKDEDSIFMIVECKRKNRNDGLSDFGHHSSLIYIYIFF